MIIINDEALEKRMQTLVDFYFTNTDELARRFVTREVDRIMDACPNITLATGHANPLAEDGQYHD